MSCNNCTCDIETTKHNLFLDCDDVILEYFRGFNVYIKENYGIKINKNALPEEWGYTKYIGDKEHLFAEFSSKFNDKLEIMSGAIDFVNKAKAMGWTITLITNHPNCFTLGRIQLLNKNKLYFDNYYSCGFHDPQGQVGKFSKAEFLKRLGYKDKNNINVLVDDKFSHAHDFVKANLGYGVTMDRSYNEKDIANSKNNDKLLIVKSFVDPYAQNRAAFKETLKLLEKLKNS